MESNLIDEQNAGNDVGFALLAPLGDFLVDLASHFGGNFASVAAEESQVTWKFVVKIETEWKNRIAAADLRIISDVFVRKGFYGREISWKNNQDQI